MFSHKLLKELLMQTVARGYCSDKNSSKVLDPDLLEGIVDEIIKALEPHCSLKTRLPLIVDTLNLNTGNTSGHGSNKRMPLYKSQTCVWALKIARIGVIAGFDYESIVGAMLIPEDTEHNPIHVDELYLLKHKPRSGGYYVLRENGEECWSHQADFEADYLLIPDIS